MQIPTQMPLTTDSVEAAGQRIIIADFDLPLAYFNPSVAGGHTGLNLVYGSGLQMQTVETLSNRIFGTDSAMRAELIELATPSYEDPRAVVDRELAHCDTLYLARDGHRRLVCFYLVAHEMVEVTGQASIPAVYMGLSATRQDTKNSGKIAALYARALEDARRWQAEIGQRVVLWGTTATPSVYLAVHAFLSETAPYLNGTYHPDRLWLADALRRKLTPQEADPTTHPYVLKGVAQNTRYSRSEVERIARICRLKKFSLFEDLEINETNGDRLLFTGHVPATIPRLRRITAPRPRIYRQRIITQRAEGYRPCTSFKFSS